MGFALGMNGKFYCVSPASLSSSVAPAAVSWGNAVGNIKDLTLTLETGEADVTTRGNNGWRATAATLKEANVEFEMVWDPGDDFFEDVQAAFLGNDELSIAVMDGDITTAGSQGLATNVTVSKFSRSEPLEEAMTVSVTMKPSSQTQWYTKVGT